ncbi:MAG: xanthine dehydrogenase family protein molybdopterin-binding subunit [Desulfobacterales bacterium]|nr:xanthine dehydrogenase family protein molybdopterin-binding subunit [Desulfobacterales bacterium]
MEQYSVVGRSLPRVDAVEKVTGRAKYSVDLKLPGMLYGKILRSKYPHAKIISVDVSAAERLGGVKAIVTSQDLSPRKVPIKWGAFGARDTYLLARDKVRYVGDEIAGVAAVDEETAEEALDLIRIQYEELPAVFDTEKAMEPCAPIIHDSESNIINEVDVEYGDVTKGFREAFYTHEDKFSIPYVHQCHLEPTACLADFDGSGKLTLWITSMDPFVVRHFLSEGLDIPESKVRVIQPYIGGAFGAKGELLRQYVVCALLAKKVGKPVRIVNTREEELTSTRPLMPLTVQVKIGVKKDGTFIALHIKSLADAGAYGRAPKMMIEGLGRPTGLYRCPNVRLEGKTVCTNKVPVGPYRSFGSFQVMFGFESVLDMIAGKLGIDPAELRLKNVHKTGDVSILGAKIDSCGIEDCIGKITEYAHWRKKKANKQSNRGIGIACSSYLSESRVMDFGGSVAFIKILEDGRIGIISGELDWGQGTATIFRQIAAEELGVSLKDVDYSPFDTDVVPFILGPYGGGRNTVSGGNAVKIAANDAKIQILNVAGEMLEAKVEDLEMKDRRIYVKGSPDSGVSYSEIARFAIFRRGGSAIIGKGIDEPDTVKKNQRMFGNATRAYPFTAQIAEVEVDKDTGIVRILSFVAATDVGRAINPSLAEGQMQGAIAQGIGATLMEKIMYEEGVVMNPNFTEYKVPTVLEVPSVKTFLVETNDPHCPYGAKSIGMVNMMPVAAALANAIYDAVGVRMKELPITPDKVLKALEEKGGR